MNLVLLTPDDFTDEHHVRFTDRRAQHIRAVHHAKLGDKIAATIRADYYFEVPEAVIPLDGFRIPASKMGRGGIVNAAPGGFDSLALVPLVADDTCLGLAISASTLAG